MILLTKTPEEQECATCPLCGTKVYITCTSIIDTLAKLQLLLDGSLNTSDCDTCGQSVTAEEPVWVNMENHGIDPLFYVPLDYLEHAHVDPTVLSAPGEADRIFYSLDELARQVRARILIHRLPIGA